MSEWETKKLNLSRVPTTPIIEDAESIWIGGVGTFGDPDVAYQVQNVPGYFRYRGTMEDIIRKQLGDSFTMYRAMTKEKLAEWRRGASVGPVGLTLRKRVAVNWENLAAFSIKGTKLVVVKTKVQPEWVIMRGSPEESELVVDGDEISAHTLKVVKR
jgi:hypothetical protein